jgi:hypothetical protein
MLYLALIVHTNAMMLAAFSLTNNTVSTAILVTTKVEKHGNIRLLLLPPLVLTYFAGFFRLQD